MSGYTENECEWAVVDRMATLLADPPRSDYSVTQRYALFSSILCWVLERIRTHGNDKADKLAKAVWARLDREKATQAPWRIARQTNKRIAVLADDGVTNRFVGWEDLSAAELLRGLRNATAHGDGRSVRPSLDWRGGEEVLIGFEFGCEFRLGKNERRSERWEVIWSGNIVLSEEDMIAIGTSLAHIFCGEMKNMDRTVNPSKAAVLREAA